jgi:DNA-binding transcriptional MerR regulator
MEKIYYSISEVADMFEINQSNLRFWEKEFKQLNPRRNSKGTRFYTKEDIEIIKQILFLVNKQNLTLQGAKQKLNKKSDVVAKQQQILERLQNIRSELKAIAKAIE